ncbi:MAG: transcription-repair coupling factor, partial [Rhizobiales bacterium]|nr:transcription-repair coupling factor [Hyphomicrobiales bacterium]
MSMRLKLKNLFSSSQQVTLSSVADGAEGYVLAELLANNAKRPQWCFVARDSRRAELIRQAMAFFAPNVEIIFIPAWDCLPYDRVSPTPQISAQRMMALAALRQPVAKNKQRLLLLTANAALQKSLPPSVIPSRIWQGKPGNIVSMEELIIWLESNGFLRVPTVRETSEYAVRGGLVDLFAPGDELPIRLDFFGDTLETIRHFEPDTQRSSGSLPAIDLMPASEAILGEERITRFRQAYRLANGTVTKDDPLYEAVTDGRRYPGLEHWLGYLEEELVSVLSFMPDAPIVLDHLLDDALNDRAAQIKDHYETRKAHANDSGDGAVYKPAEPDLMYLDVDHWQGEIIGREIVSITPYELIQEQTAGRVVMMGGSQAHNFAAERASPDTNIFDAAIAHFADLAKQKNRVLLAGWSEGARERLSQVLRDHGLDNQRMIGSWTEAKMLQTGTV